MRIYLKNARERKGMSQADVAMKLDISESYYCLIENGQRQKVMDLTLAGSLSKILDLSLLEIIKEEQILKPVDAD